MAFPASAITESPPCAASVVVLTTIEEMESVRQVWESWPGNRDSDLAYFTGAVLSLPGVLRPHVLVVYRDGRPDAILVGRLEESVMDCKIGYLHFRPRTRILYFVYGALRGCDSRENCELLIGEVMRNLAAGEAAVAYLNFLRTETEAYQAARNIPGFFTRDHIQRVQPHFIAVLPDDGGQFRHTLSTKVRKNLRWQAKKLIEDFAGAVIVHRYTAVSDFDRALAIVEQIAQESYQRGLGVGFVDNKEIRARLEFKARRGWLHIYVLEVGGEPAAYWIGDANGRTFGSEFLGYDPAFAKYSPGMFLLVDVIEKFCDDPASEIREIDFGAGDAQYKETLGNSIWQEAAVYVFAPSVKGWGLSGLRVLTGSTDHVLRRCLARTDLIRKARKWWRLQVTRNRSECQK